MKNLYLFLTFLATNSILAQTNITITNVLANDVVFGNYNPSDFLSSSPITDNDAIVQGIRMGVSADSLKAYIVKMSTFQNRNTGADTISTTTGIGAARRWAYSKFQQFSASNENRLLPSYLQFDQVICTSNQHRNIMGVLPGTDTSNHHIILIEGHIDSRCVGTCDIVCDAAGIEDNASGSALVLELARVMSRYTYKNTIVFMLTIGEEQGLHGAEAFAAFAQTNSLPIEAVLNNDVIGGVICGNTSSAPSCPGLNDVDSLQVRLFSSGGFNSRNKQLSRYIKLQYQEELISQVNIPMMVTIMSAEDRTGRGGDHIPFRQNGFAAMRFTSANEHGDASNGAGYTDRQHTSNDVLGVDTNADMVIDSFFVDFNYLARNAVINGNAATMIAIGPEEVDFELSSIVGPGIIVNITDNIPDPMYRIAIRTTTNDWDSVYTTNQLSDTIFPPTATNYYVSVAAVDANGVESLFSREIAFAADEASILEQNGKTTGLELLQNKPNPFDEATIIGVAVNKAISYKKARILVSDINGRKISELPIELSLGINEVVYEHGYGKVGTYTYTLVIDGKEMTSKKMVFAN